jgi:hypothetical protein
MQVFNPATYNKLKWALPWLSRYPFWRAGELTRRLVDTDTVQHLIITVANHFEPSWLGPGVFADLDSQLRKVEGWCKQARATGDAVRDHDGTRFRHTYFSPGEQYQRELLEMVADLEADGIGEVEIHLHHGIENPDTPANLKRALVEFRDVLAEEHKCLSVEEGDSRPRYAFVHGNLALANSMGGKWCGVDNEMEILAETGCYADMTLPAAPAQSQVSMLNMIYQCGRPLSERSPHRTGRNLRVGEKPVLPIILTGPLIFNWDRRRPGYIEDGALCGKYPVDTTRLNRWRKTHIAVKGRPDWIFIKLFCHGFFPGDQEATMGETVKRFWSEVADEAERTGRFKIHFATAREVFNIAMAAVDGHASDPSAYRDYRLRPIRQMARQFPCSENKILQLT